MQRTRYAALAAIAIVVVATFLWAPDDGRFARVPVMVLLATLAFLAHLALEAAPAAPGERSSSSSPEATASPLLDEMPPPVAAPATLAAPSAVAEAPAAAVPQPEPAPAIVLPAAPPVPVGHEEHPPGFFEVDATARPELPEVGPLVDATLASEVPAPTTTTTPGAQDAPADPADEDPDEDLADLPDPPVGWPPGAIEVPLVFHQELPPPPAGVPQLADITLAGDAPPVGDVPLSGGTVAGDAVRTPEEQLAELLGQEAVVDLTVLDHGPVPDDAAPAPERIDEAVGLATTTDDLDATDEPAATAQVASEDPWLAFASAMFGPATR